MPAEASPNARRWLLILAALGMLLVPLRAEETRSIYMVSNGWHTGVAMRVADLPAEAGLLKQEFPRQTTHLLVGWGDADFYRQKRVTPWILFKALFLPTASAFHVVPIEGSVEKAMPASQVRRVEVKRVAYDRAMRRLAKSFSRGRRGELQVIGEGFSPESRFYAAEGAYYFPKTCNVWTAQVLREAGLPLYPPTALTAGDLEWQMRRHGELLNGKRRPADEF